jgi:hypothetical protein
VNVRYALQAGWPSQINLHQRVSAFTHAGRVTSFKIGITSNPDRRASVYKAHGTRYEEMVVLYQTSSKKNVREMEQILIHYFRENERIDNNNAGGGGLIDDDGPYYLYITLQRPQLA